MRAFVFTAIFLSGLAVSAQADTPSVEHSCMAPGACFTVNTGTCGSVLSVDRDNNAAALYANDPRLPAGVQGVCGVFSPPFYSGQAPPAPFAKEHCLGANCVVPLGN